jgi:hypothetical protein
MSNCESYHERPSKQSGKLRISQLENTYFWALGLAANRGKGCNRRDLKGEGITKAWALCEPVDTVRRQRLVLDQSKSFKKQASYQLHGGSVSTLHFATSMGGALKIRAESRHHHI